MQKTLTPDQLALTIAPDTLGFATTAELSVPAPGWIGQPEAEAAARFGLGIGQPGFHLIVVGEPGSGRTSLMLRLMREYAARRPVPQDMLYLYNFDDPGKPLFLRTVAGCGAVLRQALDQFIRTLTRKLPQLAHDRAAVEALLETQLAEIGRLPRASDHALAKFGYHLAAMRQDVLDNLELFQRVATAGPALAADAEGMLETYLQRLRANLIVDRRHQQSAPVIYDDDPGFQSLFGSYEPGPESMPPLPEFMRLRAGNLLRADGGMLMLQLRDIHSDQQSGQQILEKLHRYLRNGHVQIEESASHAGQTGSSHLVSEPVPVRVQLVLVVTRDEFYTLQEEAGEFARFFNVKVDFADDFKVTPETYGTLAAFIAGRCAHFGIRHFSAPAVALLLETMHRRAESKTHVSSHLYELQQLMLAAASAAAPEGAAIERADVEAALQARYRRHRAAEMELLRSIVDGELMVRVHGREPGQINGLTYIDLGDVGFGSPVKISARCFAGEDGIINIDREVEMTGPNHDKGLFILQSWLSASFTKLTPLSLNASLVFEQEYHGVEGDSATCAELYALLSAISGVPMPQGMAVTGAMNQHGEVMAVGGINEKIEGYFRVCQAMGLDGAQGVLIPARNVGHLMLNDEVVAAVAAGRFHIQPFSHVLEGLEYLTGLVAGEPDEDGDYRPESVMGRVQRVLESFRKIYDSNKSDD